MDELILINPTTGAREVIPLDGTPQTSELINTLFQQGFVQDTGVTDDLLLADERGPVQPTQPGSPIVAPAAAPVAAPPRMPPGFGTTLPTDREMQPTNIGGRSAEPLVPTVQYEGDRLGPQDRPATGFDRFAVAPWGGDSYQIDLPRPSGLTPFTPPTNELRFTEAEWGQLTPEQRSAVVSDPRGYEVSYPDGRSMHGSGPLRNAPVRPSDYYQGPGSPADQPTSLPAPAIRPGMPPGFGTTGLGQGELGIGAVPDWLMFTQQQWEQLPPQHREAFLRQSGSPGLDPITQDAAGNIIVGGRNLGPVVQKDYPSRIDLSNDMYTDQVNRLAPGPGLLDPTRSPGNLVPGATPPQGPGAGTSISLSHPTTGQTQTIVLDGTPETSAILNDLIQNQGFVLDDPGRLPVIPPAATPPVPPAATPPVPPPATPPVDPYAEFPTLTTPQIEPEVLPDIERISPRFGDDFERWYSDLVGAQADRVGRYYDFPMPRAGVALMDLGRVPQPQAQTPEQFEALQFLLSGQGFDPATMARMRAGATDAAAMAGRSGAGTARLLGQQAGLAGSPAALALEASARRRQGDATTRALNQIEIQNAMQGMQNRLQGSNLELNRQISGAAQANQMALNNASNILGAMRQNVGNLQQTEQFNVGNLIGQQMTRAGEQAGLAGAGGQRLQAGALGLAGQAGVLNPQAQQRREEQQAALNRQRALENAGLTMRRYEGDSGWLGQMATGSGADFFGAGTRASERLQPGSAWSGLGLPSVGG